jgi:Ni,Fe-hydrogenase III large subunit
MNFEARNGFDINHDERVRKIWEAAAAAVKQLDRLRSAGPMARVAFDAEVARIAQEKLHPHGCDLVVHRTNDGIARFLIRVQNTGREYDLIKSFPHRDNGR